MEDCAGGLGGSLVNFENDDDSQWVPGKVDGALDLGADDTLDNSVEFLLDAVDAQQTGGFTIALWVNPGEMITSTGDHEWTLVDNGTFGFNLRTANFQGQLFDQLDETTGRGRQLL